MKKLMSHEVIKPYSTSHAPKPPEIRKDGLCVARKHGICKKAVDCPYLISGPCVAWCDVCGYDDTDV
jgi:hypothetical protein